MKEKEVKKIKLWQVLLIIIICLLSYVIITNYKKPNKKEEVNINYKNQIVNNISFEKIKIYSKNNKYYFTSKVINKTNDTLNISPITVTLDDITFNGYIGDKLNSKEYKMLTMETNKKLDKIKKITIKVDAQK